MIADQYTGAPVPSTQLALLKERDKGTNMTGPGSCPGTRRGSGKFPCGANLHRKPIVTLGPNLFCCSLAMILGNEYKPFWG